MVSNSDIKKALFLDQELSEIWDITLLILAYPKIQFWILYLKNGDYTSPGYQMLHKIKANFF